ncbi:MAG: hypothetical protein LBC26_00030 [Oscillospiraceae bacterium]|jgi:hypothetical protein|nr:hypothetical protein [Oscillospiraceae bacterium]
MYNAIVYGSAVAVVLLVLTLVIALGLWVLYALGFMEVAKKSPYAKFAWMAWVPVCNYYLLGLLVPDPYIGKFKVNQFSVMLAALAGVMILSDVAVLGSLISIGFYALTVLINMEIFKRYRPQSAVVLAIFYPIGYFIIRSQVMSGGAAPQQPAAGGYAPGYQAPPQPGYQPAPDASAYQQQPAQPGYQPPQAASYQQPSQPQAGYQPQPGYQPAEYQPQPGYQPADYQPGYQPQPPQGTGVPPLPPQ